MAEPAERLTGADIHHLQVVVVRQPTGGLLAIELQDLSTGAVLLRVDPPVSQWLAAHLMMATTQAFRLMGTLPGDRPSGLVDDYGAISGSGSPATDVDGYPFVPDGAGGWRDAGDQPGLVWERGTWRPVPGGGDDDDDDDDDDQT